MLKNTQCCGWFAVLISLSFISCNQLSSKSERPTFKEVEGIRFEEVRREFDTGYSFSKHGFQQNPEWTLYFLPKDSVMIYSPFERRYIHYPIYYDHEKVINFAREWLRVIHVSKDSLIFQLLEVQAKEVKRDLSNVYMKFYSHHYINKVLGAKLDDLRRPTRNDTLYISWLIERSRKYPDRLDSLLSARNPVRFESKIQEITVTKRELSKDNLDYSPASTYLNPEFDIFIKEAYQDFNYTFSVVVDENGRLRVGRFAALEKEFVEPRKKLFQALIEGYLHRYLVITPGETLGMRHSTEVLLHVKGIKK